MGAAPGSRSADSHPVAVDFSKIEPRLYLSSIVCAERRFLASRGVTHVVSVIEEPPLPPGTHELKVKHVRVRDHADEPISDHFREASEFIADAAGRGGRVLVHCSAGVSRSATIVAAHLMRTHKLNAERALGAVQAARPSVQPNLGFVAQLVAFEREVGCVERSECFLAQYAMDVVFGKAFCEQHGVTAKELQQLIDECGDVNEAMLKVVEGRSASG